MSIKDQIIKTNAAFPEMTKADVAKVVGCSQPTVGRHEKRLGLKFAKHGSLRTRQIQTLLSDNPHATNREIADAIGSSSTYVSKMRKEIGVKFVSKKAALKALEAKAKPIKLSVSIPPENIEVYDFVCTNAKALDLTPEEYILEIIEDRIAEEAEKLK